MIDDKYKRLQADLEEFLKLLQNAQPSKTGRYYDEWWVQLPSNGWGIVDKKLLDHATKWCYSNVGALGKDWFFRESSIFVFNSLEQRTQFILAVL